MRTALSPVLLGVLLALALGCGEDSDGGGECASVDPCGGDVVGTWELESICLTDAAIQSFERELGPECQGAIVGSDVVLSGATLEYSADGVLTSAGSSDITVEYRFTEACLASAEVDFPGLSDAACAGLEDDAELDLMDDELQATVTCTLVANACECAVRQSQSNTGSSSYAINGDTILVGGIITFPYCVSGDTLRYGDDTLGIATARRR